MSKLALVTGATSGLGRAFAGRPANDGYDVIAAGRNTERLEQLVREHPQVSVRPVTADLATFEGITAVAGIAAAEPLDLLVNNAGVAHYMPLADLPADNAAELVNVKVLAPGWRAPGCASRSWPPGWSSRSSTSGRAPGCGPRGVRRAESRARHQVPGLTTSAVSRAAPTRGTSGVRR